MSVNSLESIDSSILPLDTSLYSALDLRNRQLERH